MSRWPVRRLADVCDVNPRQNGSENLLPDSPVTFVPMAAVNEATASIDAPEIRPIDAVRRGYSRFREGDVLFAKITPSMENGKAAVARDLLNGVGFGSTEFHVIRPSPDVLPEWILGFLRQPRFREVAKANFTGTAGQQRVPVDFLKQALLPVPPLSEQRRLTELLARGQALLRLRTQSDILAGDLLPGLYNATFGDPELREEWPVTTIEHLARDGRRSIRTGPFGSQLKHSEFATSGVPVVGIENVVNNEFRWTEPRCVSPERFSGFSRFEVCPGDVLITIMGTVGRVAVAPADLPTSMSTKHLCVVTPARERIHPRYLWAALLHDREVLQQTAAAGGGAIMTGWNLSIVKNLRIRVPPLSMQENFAERIASVHALQGLQRRSREGLERLFGSMLHHAMQGQL